MRLAAVYVDVEKTSQQRPTSTLWAAVQANSQTEQEKTWRELQNGLFPTGFSPLPWLCPGSSPGRGVLLILPPCRPARPWQPLQMVLLGVNGTKLEVSDDSGS